MNKIAQSLMIEKVALNLRGLKAVEKRVINPIRIRGGLNLTAEKSIFSRKGLAMNAFPKTISEGLVGADKTIINEIDKNLINKIMTGKGGAYRAIKNPQMFLRLPKFPKNKDQQQMLNRVLSNHELQEILTKKKRVLRIASHMSPDVLVAESNLVVSLPKKYNPVKNFMKKLRKSTGEDQMLFKGMPGFEYGKQKISPAGKKHILKSIKNEQDRMLKEQNNILKIFDLEI